MASVKTQWYKNTKKCLETILSLTHFSLHFILVYLKKINYKM